MALSLLMFLGFFELSIVLTYFPVRRDGLSRAPSAASALLSSVLIWRRGAEGRAGVGRVGRVRYDDGVPLHHGAHQPQLHHQISRQSGCYGCVLSARIVGCVLHSRWHLWGQEDNTAVCLPLALDEEATRPLTHYLCVLSAQRLEDERQAEGIN